MLCFECKRSVLLAEFDCVFYPCFEGVGLFFELLEWGDVVIVKVWMLLQKGVCFRDMLLSP